jgi:hypothetical protein
VRTGIKLAGALLLLIAGCSAIPVVAYALENRHLDKERSRVQSLVRIGQSIDDAQRTLAQNGFRFLDDTPTRFISYQHLLVITGEAKPSILDTFFYVMGAANPLRTQSPYVVVAATLDGVVTAVR